MPIWEKLGIEHHAASTYHQLRIIAQEYGDFAAAEAWSHKALAINERLGNEDGTASTYQQLGIIAQEQRDFAAAEAWYRKSLVIKERQGNEHGAATTYHQLGIVAGLRGRFEEAGQWTLKALCIFTRTNDEHSAMKPADIFAQLFRATDAPTQAKLRAMWAEAGLGDFHEPGTSSADPAPPGESGR